MRIKRRLLVPAFLCASLTVGAAGCSVDDATVSSFVDVAATTSASLVEIVVRAVVNGFLARFNDPDLSLPLSEQNA